MDKKAAICEYLRRFHTGRERAIFSRELQQMFDIDGRNLRRKINELRQEGVPICSDETGYYYASSQSELDRTIGRLSEMLSRISNSREGLRSASPGASVRTIQISIRFC